VRIVQKALAYITQRDRLLVFRQRAFPEAGVQVPAGTIRSGELAERAVLREAVEETGWTDFAEPVFLGRAEFDCTPFGKSELHERWFFHLEIGGDPPETWSHGESDPAGGHPGGTIEFAFFWRPITDATELIADHGKLLPELRNRMRL
jgi:8-oxo-dGTP diphosphatase